MVKSLSRFYEKEQQRFLVIAGLDPAIHPLREELLPRKMDARVKPGHDGWA
jgi:hypothetical protein